MDAIPPEVIARVNLLYAQLVMSMIPPCAWWIAAAGATVMWRMAVGYARAWYAWRENALP